MYLLVKYPFAPSVASDPLTGPSPLLLGSRSDSDLYFLDDVYTELPMENTVPLPVCVPAYPGGTYGAVLQAQECCCKNRHDRQDACCVLWSIHQEGDLVDELGSPIPTTWDPRLEEELIERPGIGYRAKLKEEALLKEILSDEEKDVLVETHKVLTLTPGAGPSIPNSARVLEMVLHHRDAAALKVYQEYHQECTKEEACRILEHQEGHWWAVKVENNDEVLLKALD